MNINFISHILGNLGYSFIIAFLFVKFERANIILKYKNKSKEDILILSIFFSMLAVVGTYIGLDFNGAILNTRNIGVIASGILGGPYVGIISGLIAGIHRSFIYNSLGTAIPCGIATIIGGFLSAFAYKFTITKEKYKIYIGFFLCFIVENISMGLILVMGKDYLLSRYIVKNIYFPMVFMNSFGISFLILIVQDIIEKNELSAGKQAKLALEIADETLSCFRNSESLDKVCKIINDKLGGRAVFITDKRNIVASYIEGKTPFKTFPIRSEATKKVLKTGEILVVSKDENVDMENFSYISETIKSCIILPLHEKNSISGTLKIFFDKAEKITEKNRYLIIGLSNLISTQMELNKIEELESLLKISELKALQSQINPHFLFNALNTLTSYIRINPEKARSFIIDLSNYLRYNLDNNLKNVELIKELEQVNSYIRIEKARFGEKLNVFYEIDENLYNIEIPSLLIQPIVENSIKHGLLKKRGAGFIKIKIKKIDKWIKIIIEDNGIGIAQEIIDNLDNEINKNIGLKNVHQRLKLLYDEGVKIERLEQGTRISFKILGG